MAAQDGYRVSVVVFSCRDMEIAKDTCPGTSTCPKYILLKNTDNAQSLFVQKQYKTLMKIVCNQIYIQKPAD